MTDQTEQRLHGLTAIIEAHSQVGMGQGSGFFFAREADEAAEEKAGKSGKPRWVKLDRTHFITNRHVVTTDTEMKVLAEKVRILVRVARASGLTFEAIELEGDNLKKKVFVHNDTDTDVVAIDIHDEWFALMNTVDNKRGEGPVFSVLTPADFPEKQGTPVSLANDVLVIGYPRGFYDRFNLYPVVKSGIVASPWKMHYAGKPTFLIDAKLFPGSSGSVVITRPTDFIFKNRQFMQHSSGQKIFALLGIFSGEPFQHGEKIEFEDFSIQRQYKFNLGVVWYANLLTAIISAGKSFG